MEPHLSDKFREKIALIAHGRSRFIKHFYFLTCLLCLLFASASASADKIYLKEDPEGNTGKILEEYPDSIVIKFPKAEIKRIEAGEKPPFHEAASGSPIIWVDEGDSITLRLPKKSILSGSPEDLEKLSVDLAQGKSPGQGMQKESAETTDRLIQGKAFFKGKPLSGCKIRIVRVPDEAKLFGIFSAKEELKKGSSFETTTNYHGIYTFQDIPYGEYIVYWRPPGNSHWIRRLSENPDLILIPGRPILDKNIEANVKTVN